MTRTTRPARPWALLLLATLSACQVDLDVPAGAMITCTGAADCPSGQVCNRSRCVLPSEIGVPPDLVGGALTVSPPRGSAGTTFTVSLEATRPLDGPPRVILGLEPLLDLPCTATGEVSHVCTYVATGLENGGRGGRISMDVRMVDRSGNEAARNGVGALELDFAPPVLAARSAEPPSVALGAVLQVFFTTDEELGAPPVLVASRALDAAGGTRFTPTGQPGTRNYLFTHLVTPSDTSGPVDFTVELTDLVGNVVADVPVGRVELDPVAPAVSSLAVTPPRLGRTGTLTVTFDATEEAAPGTLAVTVGGRALACGAYAATSPRYTCTRAMVGDELASGTEAAQTVVVGLADPAGNRTSASGSTVFDFRAPALAGWTADPANVPLGGLIVVSLTPDEDLGPAPVLVASRALDAPGATRFTLTRQPGTRNYQFTHAVTAADASGPVDFTVDLTDAVGNAAPGVAVGRVLVDSVVPVIGPLAITPARIDPVGVVTVAFDATEPGSLLVTLGGRAMECAPRAAASPNHTCTRAMVGDELPAGTEQGQAVVVTLADAAGNVASAIGSMVFDFRAPDVLPGSVGMELTPAPGSLVSPVSALRTGARIRVSFTVDEPLGASPVVTTSPQALAFGVASQSGPFYVLEHQLDASAHAQGAYTLQVRLEDLAGNQVVRALTLPAPGLVVDTAAPAAPDVATAARILYERRPWGTSATGGIPDFRITGAAGAVEAGATVIALDRADPATAGELGRAVAGGAGAFGPLSLSAADQPDVFLLAVDGAGNVSDADGAPGNGAQATLVRDVAWTATLLGKIQGRSFPNPHGFEARQVWTSTLAQPASKPVADPSAVGLQDGTRTSVRGAPYWLPARRYAPLGARTGTGMIHDPVRGCRVAFSGAGWDGCDAGFYCNQFESCRGSAWRVPEIADPEGDGNPALGDGFPLVFAGGRAAAVLSNGADLWEWNGTSWRRIVMTDPEGDGNPGARTSHAIAYDEARQRLVLFGGNAGGVLGDLWETDFRSWRRLCTTAPCSTGATPGARASHRMVYDPVRKVTILVGGALAGGATDPTTWTWNGSTWTAACATGTCDTVGRRSSAGLTFDVGRGRAVAFGGNTAGGIDGGVYEWNGTTWTALCTTSPCNTTAPVGRTDPSFFHDPERGKVVLFGGMDGDFGLGDECESNFCGTEWEWSGTAWTEVLPVPAGPPSVSGVSPVYDVSRDRVVLFGGASNTTWLWNGAQWTQATPATVPTARSRYAATWVPSGHVAMTAGETPALVGSTYTWSGTNWTARSTLATPRTDTALASSPAVSGAAILFGGDGGTGTALCDTLQLSSAGAWTILSSPADCTTSSPQGRAGHAMVRASTFAGAPIVMVGGLANYVPMNDVWNYTSAGTWTRVSAGGGPTPRTNHRLFFDTGRNRVVLWGGDVGPVVSNVNCVDDYGGTTCHDFWEWSGSAWTRVFPVDVFGDGAPDPYRLEGIAFVTSTARGLGIESGGANLTTWHWHGGPSDRPGHVLSVLFDAAEVRRAFDVLDLEVTWVGGGSGMPGGALTPGASVQLWDNTGWRTLASNAAASPTAPQTLHWSLATDATFGATPLAERQRFMVGDQRVLSFALVPAAASGRADGMGEVATDYAEVTVRYRLAP